MKLKHLFTFIILAASAALGSGCAWIPGATSTLDTQTYEDLLSRDSRMYRGAVELIAPERIYNELADKYIAHYKDKPDEFLPLPSGIDTLEELDATRNDKQYLVIRWWRDYLAGGVARSHLIVDKKWNLEEGDIIDYYSGDFNNTDLKNKDKNYFYFSAVWAIGIWNTADGWGPHFDAPEQLLGIVCRDYDDGCDYNTSPATQIGIGRHLDSPADYRGAVAESTQPMRRHNFTLATYWGINYCMECDDDE